MLYLNDFAGWFLIGYALIHAAMACAKWIKSYRKEQ